MIRPGPSDLQQKFNAARQMFEAGNLNGAARAFAELGQVAPKAAPVAYMQGVIAARLGFADQAAKHLARADRLHPDQPDTLKHLVQAQEAAGLIKAAGLTYDRLAKRFPKSPEWISGKALMLQRQGEFDKASRLLRRGIRKMPDQAFMYRMLTAGEKLKPGDPLIQDMQTRLKDRTLSAEARSQFGFALAKVMADLGRHKEVFPYLHIANGAEREAHPFEFEEMRRDAWDLIAAQDIKTYPPRSTDPAAFRPIFLIGTPRSGTTLIERVLAAHPAVTGIGESGFATRGISVLMGQAGAYAPLSTVPQDTIDGYARAFERHARRMADVGQVVVDKSMSTYRILGAIRFAMPDARFVVIDRDPRDIAVSIYRNTFLEGRHRYASDLGDIARYIHNFRKGVAYWKQRLPEAPHVVTYETFVADPDAQTRALIAAMDLPWDDACLRPHETAGAVKTLSFHQARQPIYQSSARGWTRYADDLKPFDEVWEALNAAE